MQRYIGMGITFTPACQRSQMKLSARNQLKGKVLEVTEGATTSHVRVDLGHGVTITASITNEAVADLGLQKGDDLGGRQGIRRDDRQVADAAIRSDRNLNKK